MAFYRAESRKRSVPLAVAMAAAVGCGPSLPQVPANHPHGVVVVRFEHANDEYVYEDRVRIDGSEAAQVRSGQRVRLAPGQHTLQLESIARQYAVRDEVVTERVWLQESQVPGAGPTTAYRSTTRPALVLVATRNCERGLVVEAAAGAESVVTLRVAADLSCVASADPR